MRRVMIFSITGLATLIGMNGWAQNPLGPLYHINFTSGITVDGDLSDWSKAEWVTYGPDNATDFGGYVWNTPDAVCKFAVMYNNDAMFLAAEVEDSYISFVDTTTSYAWWERDGVQWFIDFTDNPLQEITLYPDVYNGDENASGEKWLPGEMIIAIGATADQTLPITRQWPVGTRDGGRSDSRDLILDDGTVVRGEVNENWTCVCKISGDVEDTDPNQNAKYIIEVKVPWSSIQKSKYYSDPADPSLYTEDELNKLGWEPKLPNPLEGSKILLTHLCIDTDKPEGGFDAQTMWVGNGDNDTNWSEATFVKPALVSEWFNY